MVFQKKTSPNVTELILRPFFFPVKIRHWLQQRHIQSPADEAPRFDKSSCEDLVLTVWIQDTWTTKCKTFLLSIESWFF